MESNIIKSAGLTGAQAEILNFLFENGQCRASFIARKINRPRGVIYSVLGELEKMSLVKRKDPEKEVSVFIPEHPGKLEELFKEKEEQLKQSKKSFEGALPNLISVYNLASNKPGVRFFEGFEGFKTVLFDTLKSRTEIYTFVDSESVRRQEEIKAINEEYVKKRKKTEIKKKLIVPETAKKYFSEPKTEFTEIRFLKKKFYPFDSSLQIYDNKVSFQTLGEENTISVLIEDKNIYKMHKLLFEYIWESLASKH